MITEKPLALSTTSLPTPEEVRSIAAGLRTPHKANSLVCAASYRPGRFDSHFVDAPAVFSNDGRFYLTYVGWDGRGYQTGLASSENLFDWHKEGLLIGRGPVGSVTQHNIALTCVMRDNALDGLGAAQRFNGRFWGTYHAYPSAGLEEGPAVIGLCSSDDLRTWEIHEPILRPSDGADWERGGLYKSWLLRSGDVFYLFYNAKNRASWPWKEQTGVAISHDLKKWQRYGQNPVLVNGPDGAFDDLFASDPCVLRHNGMWVMFYFGNSSDGHSRDGVAVSSDLLNWVKADEILVDIGLPGSIDSLHAAKPAIISYGGRLFHFYCAVAPVGDENATGSIQYHERRGIALAWSEKL